MNQNEFVQRTNSFKDKVFRLAKRLLVSTEEAEDTTQEVLLKLWNNKSNLSSYNNLEAFAMTMTKNYCLDQLKSKRATNVKIGANEFLNTEVPLDKNVEDRDSLSWVEKSIDKLPEQQRVIMHLRDIEQYDFDEIAEMLDMNEGTIRVTLSRARKTIREEMLKIHNYGIK